MAAKDPVAAAAQKYKPIQSAVPGTTLGPIVFQGGGKLFGTPGVHLHHRQAAAGHSEDLPTLAPQSRLRVQLFLVPPNTRLTFCGPRKLQFYTVRTVEADEFYKKEVGLALTPPTGRHKNLVGTSSCTPVADKK